MSVELVTAEEAVLRAALSVLSNERTEPHANLDNDRDYAYEQLALAARALVRATDALPGGEQPIGWLTAAEQCDHALTRAGSDLPGNGRGTVPVNTTGAAA